MTSLATSIRQVFDAISGNERTSELIEFEGRVFFIYVQRLFHR